MRPGRKITLAQALAQEAYLVTFRCENTAAYCTHEGAMRIDDAIDRWGAQRRLDEIPARCTRCGRADRVDVRTRDRRRVGTHTASGYAPGESPEEAPLRYTAGRP